MDDKKIKNKERVLSYILRKDKLLNTYSIARELGMGRGEVLVILNELNKEGKIKLRRGAVTPITKELEEREKIKTRSEVEELKERIGKLERQIEGTFSRLREAIPVKQKSKEG